METGGSDVTAAEEVFEAGSTQGVGASGLQGQGVDSFLEAVNGGISSIANPTSEQGSEIGEEEENYPEFQGTVEEEEEEEAMDFTTSPAAATDVPTPTTGPPEESSSEEASTMTITTEGDSELLSTTSVSYTHLTLPTTPYV